MSAFAAAAQDEDGDTISALRAENEQLRQALLTANDTLVKVSQAGAHHARTAENLRDAVIRWATRAEQAEEMLEAIGAGGVGSTVARQDHSERRLNMAPPVMTPIGQRKLDSLLGEGWAISGYSICKTDPAGSLRHGFVTDAGLVGWWQQPHPILVVEAHHGIGGEA